MNPLIIYQSPLVYEVTATSAASGYPLAFALDWRSYTWWQSADNATQQIIWQPMAPGAVSDLVIYGHNLGSVGAVVTLEGSDDGFVSDIVTPVAEAVSDDAVFYRRFASSVKAAWRLTFSNQSAAVKVSCLSLGEALLFEQPIDGEYSPLDEEAAEQTAISEGGALLGSVISHVSTEASADIKYLSDAWVRNTFYPLWVSRLSTLMPFFWAHNVELAPNDIFLMRMKSPRFSSPYQTTGRRQLTLTMIGLK
jgi:hypothetical protein